MINQFRAQRYSLPRSALGRTFLYVSLSVILSETTQKACLVQESLPFCCIIEYAGMVELADTLDLGAVTSVKVFPLLIPSFPLKK